MMLIQLNIAIITFMVKLLRLPGLFTVDSSNALRSVVVRVGCLITKNKPENDGLDSSRK